MTTEPPNSGEDVTCEGCGLTLPEHLATRAGTFDYAGPHEYHPNWTCNVCVAGGIEAVLNQLPAREEPS